MILNKLFLWDVIKHSSCRPTEALKCMVNDRNLYRLLDEELTMYLKVGDSLNYSRVLS